MCFIFKTELLTLLNNVFDDFEENISMKVPDQNNNNKKKIMVNSVKFEIIIKHQQIL